MNAHASPTDVTHIVGRHNGRQGTVISILEDVQATYNYLPDWALKIVASETGTSLVDIYGIATFYRGFSLEPRGRHLVSVCTGTACHVRGSQRLLEGLEERLELKAGGTSNDGEYSLSTVSCLGACALGPVAVVDGEYHRNVKERDVPRILDGASQSDGEFELTEDEGAFKVNVSCPSCNRSLMAREHLLGGHPTICVTASWGRRHGWMRLSSVYGDCRTQSEHEIPQGEIVQLFCPRCHAEFRSSRFCPDCDAPMIMLLVRGGGTIHFCSRLGCREQLLDLGS